jgi:hypothetical protein
MTARSLGSQNCAAERNRRRDELDRMLTEAADLEPSSEALSAHLEEGTPGEPITDPAVLAELFG